MALKRKNSVDASELENVFRSAPVEEGKSKFIGYFSPTLKQEELKKLVEIQSATHKISAWRHESSQRAITGAIRYQTGHADDGEKFGGEKIKRVLENESTVGACVVARWYGGVNIGPARFRHITNCATEAINSWRRHQEEERVKRQRVADADKQAKLAEELKHRDDHIGILRTLHLDKLQELKALEPRTPDSSPRSPVVSQTPVKPGTNYSAMPLEQLCRLETVRDHTVRHMLERLEKIDVELAAKKAALTSELP
jgi:putative IMPACT (imprinted ancient) family translation regulator